MFGFGFCFAAWILYFAFQTKPQETSPRVKNDTTTVISKPATEVSAPAKDSHFVFRDVHEIKRNGRSYFIGSVKNIGSSSARSVSVEINLFLKDKFVDQYSTYVTGDIAPGEERYFKISCGCKDEPPAEHDSYKIEVVGGY